MASNVEIKANVADPEAFRKQAAALADGPAVHLEQDDTFFKVNDGRLKLRRFGDGQAELIFYQRPDQTGARVSTYTRVTVADGARMRQLLGEALGIAGRVRKRRELYLCGQTRIHLDHVEQLGWFAELEVVLQDGQDAGHGRRIADRLYERLGLTPGARIARAYVDLINATR